MVKLQPFENGNDLVLRTVYAEENFVFRVMLPAEACEVVVGVRIASTYGLKDADGRRKFPRILITIGAASKKTPGTEEDENVIEERKAG